MKWFGKTEREKWGSPVALGTARPGVGLPALDVRTRELYERALPRRVLISRLTPDRPPVNYWMPPSDLLRHSYVPGQIILGKFGSQFLGHLDDRPLVTIAGARAGKTSTVLEPNLYLYPGSMLVLDPKGELSRTAGLRRALGHNVYVLDPFGQSGERSAHFNPLAELVPASRTIADDVASITNALIPDDGDARSRHWNDSARAILKGIILFTLTLPQKERNLITVRELLLLSYPALVDAVRKTKPAGTEEGAGSKQFYNENRAAVETLLYSMTEDPHAFGGILAGIGNRFLAVPYVERGNIFSTASTHTDFLDSTPLREISKRSEFRLADLRGERPTSIYLCLPVGRMESHYRWLRIVVQMACTELEKLSAYPRDRAPILFMMEEFATLGHMEIMERAAAYFPGFGVKLWAVLQDTTQLTRNYTSGWETFLGNAGLIQCFANGDQPTLEYISTRLEHLIEPFELRSAFSRRSGAQLLMMEGEAPAAAVRLQHEDVEAIRDRVVQWSQRQLSTLPPR